MSELYVLSNPRRHRRRRYNPDFGAGMELSNPAEDFGGFDMNPRRRHRRRHNPGLAERVSRGAEGALFQGNDLENMGVALVGLLGTQKLVEPVVKLLAPSGPSAIGPNGQAVPQSKNAWWVEPLASIGAAAGVGYLGATLINKRVGKLLALGGGLTAALNIIKQVPFFQTMVQPGSIVIGSHARPIVLPRAVALPPSASPRAMMAAPDAARIRAQSGAFTRSYKM